MKIFISQSSSKAIGKSAQLYKWLIISFLISALLNISSAFARAPLANTLIENQAVVTYLDSTGTARKAYSNAVRTTVMQVGAFELNGSHTKPAKLGSTVYMQHQLINRGNGSDRFVVRIGQLGQPSGFRAVAVFPDVNGNGVPSQAKPLCSSAGPRTCDGEGFSVELSGMDAEYQFVIAYTLPDQMDASASQSLVSSVVAEPENKTSTYYASYQPSTLTVKDTVNITLGPAFSFFQSIKQPLLSPPQGKWPDPVTTGHASRESCPTRWSESLLAANPGCTYTVMTLDYANTGGEVGDLTFQVRLPDGLGYVEGASLWSGLGAEFLQDDSLADVQGSGLSQIYYAYDSLTQTLDATVTEVAPNVAGSLTFVVLVNHRAQPGTQNTSSMAAYYAAGCNANLPGINVGQCEGIDASARPLPPTQANHAPFVVLQTYGVVVADAASSMPDATVPPEKAGANLVQQDAVAYGGTVQFTSVVTNTGNGNDVFNVQVAQSSGPQAFPEGSRFEILRQDAMSEFNDSNGDGLTDTGPMLAGESRTVILRASLPANFGAISGPLDALLTATSAGDPSSNEPKVIDSVWNRVLQVRATALDLTASPSGGQVVNLLNGVVTSAACTPGRDCDLGKGPSPDPSRIQSGVPGSEIRLPFYLRNSQTANHEYALSAELPTGWNIYFVAGQTATCAQEEAARSVSVPAGEQSALAACISIPSAVVPALIPLRLGARRLGELDALPETDALTIAVQVLARKVMALGLTPASANVSVQFGDSHTQSVVLKNIGTETCAVGGENSLHARAQIDSEAAAAGWRATLYFDKNADGRLDSGDQMLLPGDNTTSAGNVSDSALSPSTPVSPFLPEQSLHFLLKTTAPQSSAGASQAMVALDLVDRSGAACKAAEANFRYSTLSQGMQVSKTHAVDPDCSGAPGLLQALSAGPASIAPGQCLLYQTVFRNESAAVLRNVSVSSQIPVYTRYIRFANGQDIGICESSGLEGTPVFLAEVGAGDKVISLRCGSDSNQLSAQGSITLRYSVKVDQ